MNLIDEVFQKNELNLAMKKYRNLVNDNSMRKLVHNWQEGYEKCQNLTRIFFTFFKAKISLIPLDCSEMYCLSTRLTYKSHKKTPIPLHVERQSGEVSCEVKPINCPIHSPGTSHSKESICPNSSEISTRIIFIAIL